ncbi:hypothetical protein AB0K00_00370 [Dactylosporangium sp. NPDC049525]|uniref:hypothetical protein n=1 Tax=Dactylosporangium sp. NPDC049525 TaxID=3154730 RepID=UPI00342B35BB
MDVPSDLALAFADRLLDLREPVGGRYAALIALLFAAAGPALPAELTGEAAARHGFRLACRDRPRRRSDRGR